MLPLASPSSGVTFAWDAATKIFTASTDSFGPILGERADTIGKHRFFLGFGYQYFDFDQVDGRNLRKLSVVLPQADDSTTFAGSIPPRTCSINGDRLTDCGYIRDVITTDNRLNLKVHQFTTYMTFGLTNRIDVSVAIPIADVHMGIVSTATVSHNDSPTVYRHAFAPRTGCPLEVPDPNNNGDHSCLVSTPFSNVNRASGIGDITLRVKATAWRGERASVSAGLDVRLPSGDELNFLGAGTVGFRPFVVWSYRSRVSPHAFVGYEVNRNSQIADITTAQKTRLPGELLYAAGADVWLTKRLTAAVDLVGQEVFQAPRTSASTFQEPGECTAGCAAEPATPGPLDPTLISTTGTYNASGLSLGAKIKPVSTFLITANVLFRLNSAGLRYKPVPMLGISYTF